MRVPEDMITPLMTLWPSPMRVVAHPHELLVVLQHLDITDARQSTSQQKRVRPLQNFFVISQYVNVLAFESLDDVDAVLDLQLAPEHISEVERRVVDADLGVMPGDKLFAHVLQGLEGTIAHGNDPPGLVVMTVVLVSREIK